MKRIDGFFRLLKFLQSGTNIDAIQNLFLFMTQNSTCYAFALLTQNKYAPPCSFDILIGIKLECQLCALFV